jgi:chemotaxis protein methyltransferase WspC
VIAVGRFSTLLKDTIGLDADAIGLSAIDRAVHLRRHACGIADPAAYWQHVRLSTSELQALIEAVVVTETWFFRHPEAFATLGRFVADEWLPQRRSGPLRVLSLPCASGEEPYSIAMALLDAGLPPERFQIDAVDVSERALAVARAGVYGRGAFRGEGLDFRDRHCAALPDGTHRVVDSVRRGVSFVCGNLCDPTLLPGREIYDAIFCRNVMIYFDRATQRLAMAQLERLLKHGGLLFVGPSETAAALAERFVPAGVPMSFAFRTPERPQWVPAARSAASASTRRSRGPVAAIRAQTEQPQPIRSDRGQDLETRSQPGLTQAVDLANTGRLADASRACREHIGHHGPTAEAYHLLGLIADATGQRDEAAAQYRKTLYLNPHHEQALIHLALLMETVDRPGEAERLRRRARRHASGEASR